MKINERFVVQKIGDSFYAVPVTKDSAIGSSMIKLNETAYFMWEKIEEGLDLAQIVCEISKEYNVEKEVALADARLFAEQLRKVGILEGIDEA